MVGKVEKNLFLINAPAGSGKTTTIENNILNILSKYPEDQILCITYTNRAAEELTTRIKNNNVKIYTIHSFISDFIKIYFSHTEILELYFEIYGEDIKKRIKNIENNSNIENSNIKYKDKYGDLSYELLKKNITQIKYNELNFNSLYYGGISHDDLLSFSKFIMEKFPILRKRLVERYQHIYIDEYQDTSADVLDIFYKAVKKSTTKLYLLGDKMQQIYNNYDGSFESIFNEFDTTIKLDTNYRSNKKIINILNQIYNDDHFYQKTNKTENCETPKLIISHNIDSSFNDISIFNKKFLKIFVFNKDRFKTIGSLKLYESVNKMEKYNFVAKESAVDILTTNSQENSDILFKYLFLISNTFTMYTKKIYGTMIQLIKSSSIFNYEFLSINWHIEKIQFKEKINLAYNEYEKDSHSIKSFLKEMINQNILIPDKFTDIFENIDYEDVLNVSLIEFKNLVSYLDQPNVSTQHGVKGEGHDSVCFIAENSSNPNIKMYQFFEFFSHTNINLTEFQKFYYKYSSELYFLEKKLNCKFSKLNLNDFKSYEEQLTKFLETLKGEMNQNKYFNFLFSNLYDKYFTKPNLTNVKPCLSSTEILGILTAYRLFYVGCSRAKENLIVIVKKDKIQNFNTFFEDKMKKIGFEIIYN